MQNKGTRILYIDFMRAFAVFMMIQGHTVDTFLAEEYRTTQNLSYLIWHTMRGFTAPIFMFTAGMIFTYLLQADKYNITNNPRVKKGIKRAFLLLLIGYLLRYPTYRIFDFTYVGQKQWDIFFGVDALHLIGLGLLFIIMCLIISKTIKLNFYFVLLFISLIVLSVSPIITQIEWNNYLPQYLSSYLTRKYGSLFPLFPWVVYVLAGAILGHYLYKNPNIFQKKRFSAALISIGAIFVFASWGFFYIKGFSDSEKLQYWFFSLGIVFLRVGYVIVINGIMVFMVRKLHSIPQLIIEAGRKTLLLYVLHVVILYGSAWFPGFYKYYAKSFSLINTFIAVLLMFGLMILVVKYSDRFNLKNNKWVERIK